MKKKKFSSLTKSASLKKKVKPKLGRISMLDLTITNEEKIEVSVKPMTGGPNPKPAKVDGVPTWEVLSGAATLEVAEDGLSALLISSDDDLSDTIIQVDADADLGEGVQALSDTITLHTTGAKAESLGLVAGKAVPK